MNSGHVKKIGLVLAGVVVGSLLGSGMDLGGRADAQPRPAARGPYENVEFFRFGDHGFVLFDRSTGKFWRYDIRTEKGFPYERVGPGWQVEQPGAEVRPLQ